MIFEDSGTLDTKRERFITVGELIKHLKEFPGDLPVIYELCSDWEPLQIEDVIIVKGVPKSSWVMRVYKEHVPTMSAENRENVAEFVGFPGN